VGITLDDSAANASGFADPGEVVDVTVELFNPWQGASKDVASATATIVGTSPGVGVVDAMSSYGAIPAQGSASGSDPFTVALPANAPCGSTIELTLEVTSSLGTTQTTLAFRLGDPTGAGTPVTYTRTIPGGLDLPTDGSPLAERAGVADTMTIADDFEILDVDVRIDDLTHPWIGDVTLEIRGPNGYGTDIVFAMAGGCDVPPLGLGLFNNCGDDFVDTVIDDEAMGDLLIALFSVAPFTGSWFPVFNSPAWTFPDTNAQLANFDGASTGGDWTVFTSDTFLLFDHGTLNEWSLIVTPQTHACSSVADVLFADGFESGDTSAWSLAVP
jgi:subtilisin-like proprotein convertase family protein